MTERIRDVKIEDAARLLEIYSYYVKYTAITFEYEVPSLSEFRHRIESITQKYPYIVIEKDGRIMGYAYAGTFKARAAYDWSCELTVYLDRNARKQGMGRKIYVELEKRLKNMGIRNLYACVAYPIADDEYLDSNSADFHEHLGFSRVGVFNKCSCKFGRWYNMVWMEKSIGEHTENPPTVKFGNPMP